MQRVQLLAHGIVKLRVDKAVPVGDCAEEHHRRVYRQAHMHDDAEVRLQLVAAVDLHSLVQLVREVFDVGAHENDVVGAGQRRQNVDPERAGEPQRLDQEVRRDYAGREIHRKENQHPEEFAEHEIALRQRVGAHAAHDQHAERAQHGSRHADQHGMKEVRVGKQRRIGFDVKALRPEQERIGDLGGRRKRIAEYIQKRIQHDNEDREHQERIERVEGDAAHGQRAIDARMVFLLSHASFLP